MNVLGINGSLRAGSITARLLKAALNLLPEGTFARVYDGLADLPHFSPDIDTEPAPGSVVHWCDQLKWADAVIICTPEYAFGLPGSFKNVLDWAVSSGEFNEMPVIAIAASPLETGGVNAMTSLLPTLRALGTHIVDTGAITVPFVKNKLDSNDHFIETELEGEISSVLARLCSAVKEKNQF